MISMISMCKGIVLEDQEANVESNKMRHALVIIVEGEAANDESNRRKLTNDLGGDHCGRQESQC